MDNKDTLQITSREVYNDIKEALSGIGDALQVGSEHVYEILVRQQFVTSISYLLMVILMLSVGLVLIKLGVTRKPYRDGYSETAIMLFIYGGLLTLTSTITLLVTAGTILTGFINPEYGAMMEIKNFIK